jgi:uncharacterized protein (DUF427 family)
MSPQREALTPGPEHPIAVEPFHGRVRVRFAQHTVADTARALELREASHPPVYYVPLADIDPSALRPSDTTTRCPYKGEASYYDVIDPHTLQASHDAVWHYREPYPAVGAIAQYVAFYPDRVELEVEPAG